MRSPLNRLIRKKWCPWIWLILAIGNQVMCNASTQRENCLHPPKRPLEYSAAPKVSCQILEHVTSEKAIDTGPKEIGSNMEWPSPTTATEVKSFLGLVILISPAYVCNIWFTYGKDLPNAGVSGNISETTKCTLYINIVLHRAGIIRTDEKGSMKRM